MRTAKFALALVALGVLAEAGTRWAVSIKVYEADDEVGYWIKPNQSGGSPLTGTYAFNSAGFGVERELDFTGQSDVILVGDSLVFGTSKLEQEELLGPTLQRNSKLDVWPFATGSWSLANQLRALGRQDLKGAELIIFVLNSEDFNQPSIWQSEYEQPKKLPRSYLIYALQKRFRFLQKDQDPIPVRQGNLEEEWLEFRERTNIPVRVIAYDWIGTTGSNCSWLPDYIDVRADCFDPFRPGQEDLVTDGIHLSPTGNRVLAEFIRERLQVGRHDAF